MQSSEIRRRFLAFFEKRGHAVIPSSSLVPQNDPSVLFNTAGMQPLVPYLLGQKHPAGTRIVDIQKCVRTGDLDDIGDNRHFSFFEMMGNWSLGDYFKEDAIRWSFEFLTNKEEGLGLDVDRLYVTIFEGDENAPRDIEAQEIWMSLGIPDHRIYALPADDNWWSPGPNGPCGPCSEMFYDMVGTVGDLSHEEFIIACDREDVIEIWNDVFMEYEKKDGNVVGKLSQRNVDTGAGLERITAVMQGKRTAYDTDIFEEAKKIIKNNSLQYDERPARIVMDHIRTSLFMYSDGVVPDSKDRGYVLRRLIRKAIVNMEKLGLGLDTILSVIDSYVEKYRDQYLEVEHLPIGKLFSEEYVQFKKTLDNATMKIEKRGNLIVRQVDINAMADFVFDLYQTDGMPVEVSMEMLQEVARKDDQWGRGIPAGILDRVKEKIQKHQELSRSASAGMFKGGLANTNEQTVKLHTAHHLLLAALQHVLGKDVKQRGSNITEERLRMDFSFDRKMTDEEKQKVEQLVNEWIQKDLPMQRIEIAREEAEKIGAEMEFGAKYPDMVSVYFVGNSVDSAISKEFCGGPHVARTGSLGTFKILKEEASSSGVRRVKAVLL